MAQVSWKSPIDGTWTNAADWSTGTVPSAADDVTIAAVGTYTVTVPANDHAHSLTLNDAGATLQVSDTLAIGTTLALDSGTLLLTHGTIVGGTIDANGGSLMAETQGTLDGVTWEGPFVLDAGKPNSSTDQIFVQNGFRVTGAGGTGPGTISISNYAAPDRPRQPCPWGRHGHVEQRLS